jgi:hypothetical protein
LPLTLTLCQTNPQTGACINPSVPASSVSLTINAGETPTFSIFAQASGSIPLDAATKRIFVRFREGTILRGATSVAVTTN